MEGVYSNGKFVSYNFTFSFLTLTEWITNPWRFLRWRCSPLYTSVMHVAYRRLNSSLFRQRKATRVAFVSGGLHHHFWKFSGTQNSFGKYNPKIRKKKTNLFFLRLKIPRTFSGKPGDASKSPYNKIDRTQNGKQFVIRYPDCRHLLLRLTSFKTVSGEPNRAYFNNCLPKNTRDQSWLRYLTGSVGIRAHYLPVPLGPFR